MKKNKIIVFALAGMMACSLCGCGGDKGGTTQETNNQQDSSVEQDSAEEKDSQVDADAQRGEEFKANGTQVFLECQTKNSDIGEFFQAELYYPADGSVEAEVKEINVLKLTCAEEDYVLDIRMREDMNFMDKWEEDKANKDYEEIELNGYSGYYYTEGSTYSDIAHVNLLLEAISEKTSRYMTIEVKESYEGDHASGVELYKNNETIADILASITYIGNIEKSSVEDGMIKFEANGHQVSFESPENYMLTDQTGLAWTCRVDDGAKAYIFVKEPEEMAIFFETTVRAERTENLEAWKAHELELRPDTVIETLTIGGYDFMMYTSDESESEVNSYYVTSINDVVITFNIWASSRELAEEFIENMVTRMEVQ